ncbi:DNA polymerase III delta subunit [Leeuwenhoekiella aestuarii]|uniref:DNA polymerase III subunit delta n=1 Tax=Leeuwenhoekiella aestuarii TaxID=2249426 RepID=A0A4V1KPM2_9FLAO|nr:DNA polymerase III subunit delta [Leeuwenhoekiella aestuarii]RXG15891.1 DNA polymerase III delta subunit [Leeuwenhoekiella aestuarii]RXG16585.1 DNA polymerase III delta subunit [Leeuwenhoekiella aestuarii]
MEEVTRIVKDIKNKNLKPIYFLMGEEPYYIDQLADFIADNVLTEEERGFNQMVLYGRDVSLDDVVSQAKRFPMMAERQVVIVKEAQDLSRAILAQSDKNKNTLEAYAENPQPTTVLVFCYKYKKLDKRKKVYKAISKSGLIFESKKLYENQVGDWIRRVMTGKGYTVEPKAAHMLVEFLGTDLSKINNELEKLRLILPEGSTISPLAVEQNIGISKDFNNFELQRAIGDKDVVKAHRIINYFAQNPKDNPMVVTVALLFSFFQNLLIYHGLPSKDKSSVAKALKVNPYFVGQYVDAARNYPMKKVSHVVNLLRTADVKSKGVGAYNIPQGDLLKELLVQIMA